MLKRELRKLRTLNATKEMMEKAAKNEVKKVKKTKLYSGSEWSYTTLREYALYIRLQELSGYIKIALFIPQKMLKGIDSPMYEIFINLKGEEFITRELNDDGTEKGWRTAKIDALPEVDIYGYGGYGYSGSKAEKGVYVNQYGMYTLKSKLLTPMQNEKDAGKIILHWQQQTRAKEIEKRDAKITAPWDKEMKIIPEFTERVKTWIAKEAVEEQFIVYKTNKDPEGYCTHCRRNVPLKDKPVHLEKGKCSHCGKEIIYLCSGRRTYEHSRSSGFEMVDKYPGGFVVRVGVASNKLKTSEPSKITTVIQECSRVIYAVDNEKYTCKAVRSYSWENWKQKGMRWACDFNGRERDTDNFYRAVYWGYIKHAIYSGNLNGLKDRLPKRSALEKLIRSGTKMNIKTYLRAEEQNPALEMLVKMDMNRLATEIMDVSYDGRLLNQDATEIAKMLKIDNARLKRLKALDGGIVALKWFQEEKKENTVYPDEMVAFFQKAKLEPANVTFISDRMTKVQIWHYLDKQADMAAESPEQIVTTWTDYLRMATTLKYNLTLEQNYKPKSLSQAHAECIELIEADGMKKIAKDISKRFPKVNQVVKELTKYEFADKEYCIIAPKEIMDIVREGTILHHCVHTCDYYFDRISRKESYLLFLRKASEQDTPWYTLEVEPGGNIRQKRTTGDNQNDDFKKAVPFLKKWQREIQTKLSKEDQKLAEISDLERQKNYAKLRKDGNKIWHGKLQGQLLADVLEEDFMKAV